MKRNVFTFAMVIALAGCVTLSSCIGSFNLSTRLLNWNKSLGNKFVNEIVFFVLGAVQVYTVTMFIDTFVLNTIEFWSGNNPVSAGLIQEIETENGKYTVETLENGYNITNDKGEEMQLIYDESTNIWSSVYGETVTPLVKIEDNSVVAFLPNGEERNVELTAEGVLSFRQDVEGIKFYANK